MLSETASHGRTHTLWLHSYEVPGVTKSTETEAGIGEGVPGAGGGVQSEGLMRTVSAWEDEQVLEVMVAMDAQYECT